MRVKGSELRELSKHCLLEFLGVAGEDFLDAIRNLNDTESLEWIKQNAKAGLFDGFIEIRLNKSGKKTADALMIVKHNGVLIHDDVKVPRSTRGAPVKEGPQPGPIYVQNHGNPLRFRNIWLVETK